MNDIGDVRETQTDDTDFADNEIVKSNANDEAKKNSKVDYGINLFLPFHI